MMREWPLFRQKLLKLKGVHDQSDAKSSSADLYGETLREKDDELENIDILIKLMMTISPSTAACERDFSSMNREKIKSRCNLAQQALEDIMRINIDGPSLEDYNPLTPLQTWLNEGKGVRHLNHTTGYKKKPKNKDSTQLEPVCQIALPIIEDSQNDQNILPMEELESAVLNNHCLASLVELNSD